MTKRRGTTLLVTLMVAAIAMIVSFTLAAVGFMHLNVSSRTTSAARAEALAESALSIATDKLVDARVRHVDYGLSNETVQFQYDQALPGESARLTFDQTDTSMPWSLNNVDRFAPVDGSTQRVPGNCVHLVAVGVSGSEKKTAESVLYFPPYGRALSANGVVRSSGGLLIGSIPQGTGPVAAVDVATLGPSGIASNDGGAQSVVLGPTSHVVGDVLSVGGVDHSAAQVDGQVKEYYSPTRLPLLDIASFDTAGRPSLQTISVASLSTLPLTGFARRQGSLDVTGDITLNRGVLFVAGDLHVSGAIAGLGAIICTGSLRVDGATELRSDNQVALLAHGDVTLGGALGKGSSAIQGMIYTEGTLRAHDLTLVGVFVANGPAGSVGAMQIDNVDVVSSPDMGRLDLGIKISGDFGNGAPGVTSEFNLVLHPTAADLDVASHLPPFDPSDGASFPVWTTTMRPDFYMGIPIADPSDYLGPMTLQQAQQYLEDVPVSQGGIAPTDKAEVIAERCAAGLAQALALSDPTVVTYVLDMNQFISPEDAVRTLYHRTY